MGFYIIRLNPQRFPVMSHGIISAPLLVKSIPQVVVAKPIVRSYFKGMFEEGETVFPVAYLERCTYHQS